MAKGPGGFVSGGFDPLNAPDAPTIDSVSAGVLSADVTVSAPTDAGQGTITSYVVSAKQGDESVATGSSSEAGVVSVTLTAGGTTEFAVQAFSEFGPGAFSGYGNSTSVLTGQELYAWGTGDDGRNGDGTVLDRATPVKIGSLTTWSQTISGGGAYGLATKTDGTLWAWGRGDLGSLGDNTNVDKSSPIQVGALTNWSQICSAFSSVSAIKTDGTLWGWGFNSAGEVGDGTTTPRSSPVQIGSLTDWSKLGSDSSVGNFFLAINTSGELYAWGDNSHGQLGQNNRTNRNSPVQVGADTDWYTVAVGLDHTLAIKTDGTLWAWGENLNGRLGDGTTTDRSSPIQIGALTNWASVSGGNNFSLAIKTDGTMWAWGDNGSGRLGVGDTSDRNSPVQIGLLTTWSVPSAGSDHAGAIKTDGTLWMWGNNSNGQLGTGTGSVTSPVQAGSETAWQNLSCLTDNNIAILGTTS